tara:strand:- start:234 stop:548 length:315 start_codon:yes stop_codon:yes gene_type:complete
MVLTRSQKARGITEQDNIAANTLLQLHKDNSILKKLKEDKESKDKFHEKYGDRFKLIKELHIMAQIKILKSNKDYLNNIISSHTKYIEEIDVELEKLFSRLEEL